MPEYPERFSSSLKGHCDDVGNFEDKMNLYNFW